ncbi:hypothetical protein AURDEDRAFT_178218 [Auricularia subglabra TFB-10046 SS5]|uniref:Uncharacterized protein n=1 Tax=Auricularia subglabra (strain TFB-10046 / SS5) TaxID=717982 RepID=J0WK64_AURST|nr:hypothetical protein AURDEDRAFT_178218 [Auricularia subglabra TFB-10046 SS5]
MCLLVPPGTGSPLAGGQVQPLRHLPAVWRVPAYEPGSLAPALISGRATATFSRSARLSNQKRTHSRRSWKLKSIACSPVHAAESESMSEKRTQRPRPASIRKLDRDRPLQDLLIPGCDVRIGTKLSSASFNAGSVARRRARHIPVPGSSNSLLAHRQRAVRVSGLGVLTL